MSCFCKKKQKNKRLAYIIADQIQLMAGEMAGVWLNGTDQYIISITRYLDKRAVLMWYTKMDTREQYFHVWLQGLMFLHIIGLHLEQGHGWKKHIRRRHFSRLI